MCDVCVCFSPFIAGLFPENLAASAQTRPTTVGNKIRVSRYFITKVSAIRPIAVKMTCLMHQGRFQPLADYLCPYDIRTICDTMM